MIALEPGRTTLRNVHLQADGDPLALKLRLARLLDAADFGAAGLPPVAILVVRHLDDPLPGRLRLGHDALLPPPAWERAMRQALDAQARRAARPALGPVPGDAPAVLFANHAELLACAATAFLAGTLNANWWWHSIFPNADLPRAVFSVWQDSPEHLPAALELLAQRGQAPAFVRALDRATAHRLLGGMLKAFGLASLLQVFQAPAVSTSLAATPSPHIRTAPWQFVWPAIAAGDLPLESQALLGIGLALQRSPSQVRTPRFAEDAHHWRQAISAGHASEAPPTVQASKPERRFPRMKSISTHKHPSGDKTKATVQARHAEKRSRARKHLPAYLNNRSQVIGDSSGAGKRAPKVTEIHNERSHTKHPRRYPTGAMSAESMSSAFSLDDIGEMPGRPQFAPAQDEALLVEIVHTRFGGVFYLLNLALLLGFYTDFSAPLNPGLALSPWDFLALVGRELVGPELETDLLWPLLARLAGRHLGELPGQGFEPPDGLSFADWRDQTVMQVRLQLLVAVRLEQESALRALFFEQPARIEHASTRLDVFFSLAQHPIQIRLAGLDRDPWWIPAAGRFVVYHYD